MIDRSYDLRLEQRDTADELARLRTQFELSWEQEFHLLSWLGLRDGLSVLELGCGPGYVTQVLCRTLPACSVTAIDHDEQMLGLARESLALGGKAESRVSLACESIYELSAPENRFDFAIARYVFQHLSAPAVAAREALRVLKPGGKLAIIDVDAMFWGIAQPHFAQFAGLFAKAGAAQQSRGGDRQIGRKLWRLLRETGFVNVQLHAFVYHSDALGMEPFLCQFDSGRLMRALAEGQLELNEFAQAQHLCHRFEASADAYVLMAGLLAYGEKCAN